MNEQIGGIGNSNGDFAEEYFFNSFEKGEKTFFGEKFDRIEKNVKGITVTDEYDILLINGKTVGIVEVKYSAQKRHIKQLIKKAETFRINQPYYANYQIYLALAALSFDNKKNEKVKVKINKNCTVEDYFIRNGIAVIKQVGDKVVINDENLKVF